MPHPSTQAEKKTEYNMLKSSSLNAFTTENPLLGTRLVGINIGRGFGAVEGARSPIPYPSEKIEKTVNVQPDEQQQLHMA